MSRRRGDFYETAAWQVDALTNYLPEMSGSVWCPCVGDGSLMRRLRENRPDLGPFVTNDIDPTREADHHLNARVSQQWNAMVNRYGRPDWVVENPPFDAEMDILRCAIETARCGVAFMARISFAEPTRDRGPWLAENPYDKRITLERYSFTGNGKSDSATTDWLVWAKVPLAKPFGISAYGYKNRGAQHADLSKTGRQRTETSGSVDTSSIPGSRMGAGRRPRPSDRRAPLQDRS
mgnify:CR=1 FL=1